MMNKEKDNQVNLCYILLTTILLIVLCFVLLHTKEKNSIIPHWDFSDEQIVEYGPYWIEVPAMENEGLNTDINGMTIEEDPNTIYLILPNSVDTSKLVFYYRDGFESNYEARREVDASKGYLQIAGKTLSVITTDMPIVYLETDDEFCEFGRLKESDDKEKICSGKLNTSDSSTETEFFIKLRGNGTMYGDKPKKPFSLILDEKRDLAGLGEYKSWNLLADYYDPSLMRNYIAYYLSDEVGIHYQPKFRHVVLYVDGNYEGLFLLTTKIKVGKGLVELDDDDWLICWQGTRPKQEITYSSNSWIQEEENDYPYVELIFPEDDFGERKKEKQKFVQEYINSIEDHNSNSISTYLDIENAAKYYLVQEFCANVDAAYRSTYSYYDNDTKKLYFSPIWDMDNSFGTGGTKVGYNGEIVSFAEPLGWKVRNLSYYHDWYSHKEFKDMVEYLYYYGGVREKFYEGIDEYINERNNIKNVAEIDFKIFRSDKTNDWEVFVDTNSYEEYSDRVLNFYVTRLRWMDEQILKEINE